MVSAQGAHVVEKAGPNVHGGELGIRTVRIEEGGVDGRVGEGPAHREDGLLRAAELRQIVVRDRYARSPEASLRALWQHVSYLV